MLYGLFVLFLIKRIALLIVDSGPDYNITFVVIYHTLIISIETKRAVRNYQEPRRNLAARPLLPSSEDH